MCTVANRTALRMLALCTMMSKTAPRQRIMGSMTGRMALRMMALRTMGSGTALRTSVLITTMSWVALRTSRRSSRRQPPEEVREQQAEVASPRKEILRGLHHPEGEHAGGDDVCRGLAVHQEG